MGLYLHLGCWKLTNAALSQQRSKKDNLNKRLFLFSFFFKQIIWGFRTTRIPNIQEETDVVKERQRVAKHWNRKRKSKKHSVRENRQHSWVDRGFQHREGNYKKAETKDSKLKNIYISDMKNPFNGLINWRNLHPRRRSVNGTSVRNYQNENS